MTSGSFVVSERRNIATFPAQQFDRNRVEIPQLGSTLLIDTRQSGPRSDVCYCHDPECESRTGCVCAVNSAYVLLPGSGRSAGARGSYAQRLAIPWGDSVRLALQRVKPDQHIQCEESRASVDVSNRRL